MIRIRDLSPNIIIDMRYASTNNFTGKVLYDANECYLCEPAAHRLIRVQKKLEKKGLGLKIWDCYRPLSVQKKLWDIVPDPRYVADPKTGSRHNRGASIDLTLVDKTGKELEMPTAFDEFSEKAHRTYMNLPVLALKNRELLQTAMEAEGFTGLVTEWWHFDDPQWNHFALRDEPLSDSRLLSDQYTTHPLNENVEQLVVVVTPQESATQGELSRFEKIEGQWKKAGKSWKVSLGTKGASNKKIEGDKKSPLGLFDIGKAYGKAPSAPPHSKWPYQPLTEGWVCVDDPRSTYYNQVFDSKKIKKKDWGSAENMINQGHLYEWVINIEYNTPNPQPQKGSCIFMHVWRKEDSGTEGCTAMEKSHIVELLQWLKPSAKPQILQTTLESYELFRNVWNLP
ncbi:MAG: D-alanyl-D-alanine dipeptidase [Elusimicrobiota bacterium]